MDLKDIKVGETYRWTGELPNIEPEPAADVEVVDRVEDETCCFPRDTKPGEYTVRIQVINDRNFLPWSIHHSSLSPKEK